MENWKSGNGWKDGWMDGNGVRWCDGEMLLED